MANIWINLCKLYVRLLNFCVKTSFSASKVAFFSVKLFLELCVCVCVLDGFYMITLMPVFGLPLLMFNVVVLTSFFLPETGMCRYTSDCCSVFMYSRVCARARA